MKILPSTLALALALTLALSACAPPYPGDQAEQEKAQAPRVAVAEPIAVAPGDLEALKAKLVSKLGGGADSLKLESTQLAGIYEVREGLQIGYVSADGRYLLSGDLIDLDSGARLTETRRKVARAELLNQFKDDDTIVFSPKSGLAKYTVTVFTDVDCQYCRLLHSQIAQYNDEGIAVRYVFFPRAGLDTPSYHVAEQVWCSVDRRDALTRAKNGEALKASDSCPNPVKQHLQAAMDLALRGTPAILLPDGELLSGYVAPPDLLKTLQQKAANPAS